MNGMPLHGGKVTSKRWLVAAFGHVALRIFRAPHLIALGVIFGSGQAAAEDVVIPYECEAVLGVVQLTRSAPKAYRILGPRDRQIYSACDPANPNQCKNYQLHRFDIDCNGSRVAWLKVAEAAARLDGERVSVARNQLMLEVDASPPGAQPYPSKGWDLNRDGGGAGSDGVVTFPTGFAPALGMKPMFTESAGNASTASSDPYPAPPVVGAQSPQSSGAAGTGYGVPYDQAEAGGWDTQSKAWSQSPRGEPLDEEAKTGWDAEKVIEGGNETAKALPQKHKSAAAAKPQAGQPSASYGMEQVTSQQLPEIGGKSTKKSAASQAAPEAQKPVAKKVAPKPADSPVKEVARSQPPKSPAAAAEPAEPAKSAAEAKTETPMHTAAKVEAAQGEPSKPQTAAAPAASEAPSHTTTSKTETAMLEQPHAVPPSPPATVADAHGPASAQPDPKPQEPQQSAAPEAPVAAAAPPAAVPSAAETTAVTSPPAQETAPAVAPSPAASSDVAAAPLTPAPVSQPGDTKQISAEVTLQKEPGPAAIETSSISVAGQKVPVLPAMLLGGATLLMAAGFYFMMRRGQEVEIATYVERDFGRVSLGGTADVGTRLAGPSFELPMPGEPIQAATPEAFFEAAFAPAPAPTPAVEFPMFAEEAPAAVADLAQVAVPEPEAMAYVEPRASETFEPVAAAAPAPPPPAEELAPEVAELARVFAEAEPVPRES